MRTIAAIALAVTLMACSSQAAAPKMPTSVATESKMLSIGGEQITETAFRAQERQRIETYGAALVCGPGLEAYLGIIKAAGTPTSDENTGLAIIREECARIAP